MYENGLLVLLSREKATIPDVTLIADVTGGVP